MIEPADERPAEKARLAALCVTIAVTSLAYSTSLSSFLHAKYMLLGLGTALLGLTTLATGQKLAKFPVARPLPGCLFGISFFAVVADFDDKGRHLFAGDALRPMLIIVLLPLFGTFAYSTLLTERSRGTVIKTIIASACAAALLAIGQYMGALDFFFPRYPGASPIYSVFGNSGLLGGYLALALPLLLSIRLRNEFRAVNFVLATTLLVTALALSGARTAWLAAVVGCIVPAIVYRKWKSLGTFAAVAALAVGACVVLAPSQTISRAAVTFTSADAGANLRVWFWRGAWEMFRDHPWVGVALGRFPLKSPISLANVLWAPGGERFAHNALLTEHPHNDYLLILDETGIAGAVLFVWAAYALRKCKGPEWAGLASLAIFAIFNSPLSSPPHALAAVLLCISLLARKHAGAGNEKTEGRITTIFVASFSIVFAIMMCMSIGPPSYWLQKAQTAHVNGEPCIEYYQRATSGSQIFAGEAHEKYGIALLDAGEYEKAREQFQLALKDSDSGPVYLGLGSAEYLLGRTPAAFNPLQKAVYRMPSNVNAWRLLVRVCPAAARDEWLKKAERFLSTDEMNVVRVDAASADRDHPAR